MLGTVLGIPVSVVVTFLMSAGQMKADLQRLDAARLPERMTAMEQTQAVLSQQILERLARLETKMDGIQTGRGQR